MPVFEYKALDSKGKERKGSIDAESIRAARQKLKIKNFFIKNIQEVNESHKKQKLSFLGSLFASRVAYADTVVFLRQLATLLGAGLPLLQSLSTILEQMKEGQFKRIVSHVRNKVNEGAGLSAAFDEFPHVFNNSVTAMVEAGEASGSLDLVLERLADFGEQQLALRRKVQSTLAYPVLMFLVGVGVVFFLMSFVIPKVTKIFLDMNQELPLPTVILIKLSNFINQYWWAIILSFILIIYLIIKFIHTSKGKVVYDKFLLNAPVVGNIVKFIAISRFARTLGTLKKNGVSLIASLQIVKSVVNNIIISNIVEDILKNVSEGGSIVECLTKDKIFPPTAVQMISAGEKSGQLDEMLLRVAATCESETESRLAMMTSLIEPVMILFLGVVVGFVVLAVLLPIFEMSHLVS